MEKYRFESGSVYEYDCSARAYVFVGKLNGRTRRQFVADYERVQEFSLGERDWESEE